MFYSYEISFLRYLPTFLFLIYICQFNTFNALTSNERENHFTHIYISNYWQGKESVSGTGSGLSQTEKIRTEIPLIFKQFNIKTVLDAPCGDMYWSQHLDISDLDEYIGVDIVKELIKKNKKRLTNKKYTFFHADITNLKLPTTDLILCRDCLVHMEYEDIFTTIENFKQSGSKYLLTTTFITRNTNTRLGKKNWRPLNLQKPPFNFPQPLYIINENCTEGNNHWSDKSLALWKLEDIIVPK